VVVSGQLDVAGAGDLFRHPAGPGYIGAAVAGAMDDQLWNADGGQESPDVHVAVHAR
jgi:hypothetical protein